MPSVLNTDPILSVPNLTSVPNVPIVPIVPKMTKDDPSVPKSCLVYQQNDYQHNRCTKRKVCQNEQNVSKLTRNDAQYTKHWSYP